MCLILIVYDAFIITWMCTVVDFISLFHLAFWCHRVFYLGNSASISGKKENHQHSVSFPGSLKTYQYPLDLLYTCIVFNTVAYTEPHLIIRVLICLIFGEYLCSHQFVPYNSESVGAEHQQQGKQKLYLPFKRKMVCSTDLYITGLQSHNY